MSSQILFAQEKKSEQDNILELPDFVITGKGTLGIQSVHKLDVKDTWGLDSASRALLRPVVGNVHAVGAPDSALIVRPTIVYPFIVHGQFGLYRTPEGWLHYSGVSSPFDWSVRAEGASTQGSSDNAAASLVNINAHAGWRVPDNVMTFANSRVGVDANITSAAYNLFGSSVPTQPRTMDSRLLKIGLTQDEGTLPFAFSLKSGSFDAKDSLTKSDSYFGIDATGAAVAQHWTVRGTIHVISYAAPVSHRNLSLLDFDAQYTVAPLRYAIGVGLYTAGNTMFGMSTQLGPHASANLLIGDAELFASVARRMRDENISTLTTANPFVSLGALDSIQLPTDQLDARIGVRTAESKLISGEAQFSFVRTTTAAIFSPMGNGRWTIDYAGTSTLECSAEARWRAFARTSVIAGGALRSAMITDANTPVPFVPAAEASLTIDQNFMIPLEVSTTLNISGRRTGAPDGSVSIPAIAMWNWNAAYAFTENISMTMQVRNLLNSSYAIWQGYPGMKIFAAVGVTAKL